MQEYQHSVICREDWVRYSVHRLFAPAPAPRSAAATVHRDKTSRCFVYAAMTRPVLPSGIGVQTRQTVYIRTHDCHSVRFVVCLAKRRAPSVCCMCAAPVHANTAKQCKGANVRGIPDSKLLQTQSIHHTDKAECLSVAPLLSVCRPCPCMINDSCYNY